MSYIKSKNIQLFPSSFRGQYLLTSGTVFNPGSRLTTEYNLTTLATRASSVHQSYVLELGIDADKTIAFSLKGYLFEIKMATYLASLTTETSVWAKIKLQDVADDDNPYTNTIDTKPKLVPLSGAVLDEAVADGNFLGLSLETTDPTLLTGEYKLLILEKVAGVWGVPSKSYFRLRADEISDKTSTDKSIDEEFNMAVLNVSGNTTLSGGLVVNGDDITTTQLVTSTNTTAGTATTGAIKVVGGIGQTGDYTNYFAGQTTIAKTADATSSTDGALVVSGGVGIAKKLYVGTNLNVGGTLTVTGVSTFTGNIVANGGVNKVTITAPDTSAVLTIENGKTLTASNTLTLTGTDASSIAFGAGGTVAYQGGDLTQFVNTTAANFRGKITGTTGTGDLLFATSPTLVTPTLGVATATSINKVSFTAPATGSTLVIEEGKTLTVKESITLAGDASRTLTVNNANKTLAGAGISLTIDNNLDIAGTTAQITLGTDAHTLAFTTTGNTRVTLPTTGTLATLAESEALTNKSYNGLTLLALTTGFSISGGTTSKTLTVPATYTLGTACEKSFNDSSSASALTSSGTNLVTERDVYYGLPTINAGHAYNSGTNIFAPVTGGNSGQLLVAVDSSSAPSWSNSSAITVGNATNATNTAFTNTSWSNLAINGTLPSNTAGKTLEIGVMYEDDIGTQSRYYNFGIITLQSLYFMDAEWYVGVIYVGGTLYSLTIGASGIVYFKSDASRITSADYALKYRIIT